MYRAARKQREQAICGRARDSGGRSNGKVGHFAQCKRSARQLVMPRRRWAAGILDTRTTTKRDTINTALREITARYRRPGALEDARQSVADGAWSRVDQDMIAYVRTLRDRARVALLSNIPADHADAFLAAQPWLNDLDHVTFSGRTRPRHLLRTDRCRQARPGRLPPLRHRPARRPRRLPLRRRPRGERPRGASRRYERPRLRQPGRTRARRRRVAALPMSDAPPPPP